MPNRLTDALERFVVEADVDGLADFLLAATPEETAAARVWYRAHRKWVGEHHHSEQWRQAHPLDDDPINKIEPGIGPVLAVALAGPASAVKWIDWRRMYCYDDVPQCRRFVEVAIGRGREWCAEFVPAAAVVPMWQGTTPVNPVPIYRCVTKIVVAWELSVPDGATFTRGWASTLGWEAAADDIIADAVRSPLFPDVFHHALANGTLGSQRMARIAPKAGAELVARGIVDRDRLVAQVVDLLSAQLAAGTQRVLAGLIGSLEMTAAEVPNQWAALRGIISTAHGSLGAALLPFAVDALSSADDLLELCTTLVGRPETKQRRDLAAALTHPGLQERLGPDAARAGLRLLREAADKDLKLGAQVDAALAALGSPAEEPIAPTAIGLWHLLPPAERPYAATRIGEFPGLTPELLRWMPGDSEIRRDPPDALPDLALAAVVREAWTNGPDGAWARLAPMFDAPPPYAPPLFRVLHDGRPGSSGFDYFEAFDLVGVSRYDVTTRHLAEPFDLNFATSSMRYLLGRETLARLGRMACLLSTPSHDDLTISFEALVPRLQLNQGSTFGPLDLFQTLLRLRPVDPAELTALDGLRLALDATVVPPGRSCAVPDAIDAIRDWVRCGGLPRNEPIPPSNRWSPEFAPVELPLDPELFGVVPPQILNNLAGFDDYAARLVPRWPDARAVSLPYRFLNTEEPPGRYAYARLVAALADEQADVRTEAGRIVLASIAREQFDTQLLTSVAVEQCAGGQVSLTHLTRGWDVLASSGGLRVVWPAAVEVARHACAAQRRPTGLDKLFRLLARLAPEVPDLQLPGEIRQLAGKRGSTQVQLSARELLARADATTEAVA
jgi:hypothetical protein